MTEATGRNWQGVVIAVARSRAKAVCTVRYVSRIAHAASLGGIPAVEKTCSVQVSYFGLESIVQIPYPLTHLIEQVG